MSAEISQSYFYGQETLMPYYGIDTNEPFLLPPLDLYIDNSSEQINEESIIKWKADKIVKVGKKWVPDEHKIAAIDFFIKKLDFIPFTNFKANLLDTAQRCRGTIEESVVLIEPNKSQAWTAHIVTASLRVLPKAFLRLGEQYADKFASSLDSLPESFNLQHLKSIVIIDDASYSGTQIKNNVETADALLKARGIDDATFHIIIPYITTATLGVEQYLVSQGIRCIFYYNVLMPTVHEILIREANLDPDSKVNIADAKIKKAVLKIICPDIKEAKAELEIQKITLTRFAHKTPNHMSFAPVFVNQNVIETVNPPYKIPLTV
ncbi:MAG: hypothetical protein FJZ56_05830 [Chlamydiae bacterium]|nr:hypothetical protein [Chlamydiota bacterium]